VDEVPDEERCHAKHKDHPADAHDSIVGAEEVVNQFHSDLLIEGARV
jgi:hypothetical protein